MGWSSALLVTTSLGFLLVAAEWVEIPQFSDHRKVYRAPSPHRQGHRQEVIGLQNVSKIFVNRDAAFSTGDPLLVEYVKPYTTEGIVSSSTTASDENMEVDSDEDIASVEEESVLHLDKSPIMDYSTKHLSTTADPRETATVPLPTDSFKTHASQHLNEPNSQNKILDYLPIDLLNRVHKTLKSQPPTLKGKIRFLKVFERTLLSEIEYRLSAALSPSRTPREARDDDDDYSDSKIGFPSLEGTLMAISFLTFAVYLVRLVMMLFRTAGPVGIAPIIIGRKKRSIDDFNEETARILSYLDSTFPPQH